MDLRPVAVIVASMLFAGSASGQQVIDALKSPTPFFMFGNGSWTCATWLQDQSYEQAGAGWIAGFWSGMNSMSDVPATGHSSDPLGLIGEVKKECQNQPSELLVTATLKVHHAFGLDGR